MIMNGCNSPLRVLAGVAIVAAMGAATVRTASADAVALASHRAIYDLKLAQAKGSRALASVRGRIVYDFSGNACEGYALNFRQVTELDNGEGKVAVSDLRSATWEEDAAKSYRFNFQNYISRELVDSSDGRADRSSDGKTTGVHLTKPEDKRFDLDAAVAFPTEHMRRIIQAARDGKSVLELQVYDGSESGERLYNTLTVIGHVIPPGERKPDDAAVNQPALEGLKRWPVTISYFDKTKQGDEQKPVYAITFELYENGISRALSLDYGDFTISGEMTALELRDTKGCP
jgi:EipB-like